MKRCAGVWVLLTAVGGGCMGTGPSVAPTCGGGCGGTALAVPGVQGPWGQPVPVTASSAVPSYNPYSNKSILDQSVPLEMAPATRSGAVVRAGGTSASSKNGSVVLASGSCPPGGCPPGGPAGYGGPGVMTTAPGMALGPIGPGIAPPGAVAAVGALPACAPGPFAAQRTSVRFSSPAGMKVSWFAPGPDGRPSFDANELRVPGRYNFAQAAIYRLKLTNIPNRTTPAAFYPTLEVVPANAKTCTFLAHSSVPVNFTDDDFEQAAHGAYVIKVIYLPDPQFQDLATVGPYEIISTRLEPGADPIVEACRRGSILLIVRMGNIDLEAANTPALDAPTPYSCPPGMPGAAAGPAGMVPAMPGGVTGPGGMVPGMPATTGTSGAPGSPGTSSASSPSIPKVSSSATTPATKTTVQQTQYQASTAELAGQAPTPAGNAAPAKKSGSWSLFGMVFGK